MIRSCLLWRLRAFVFAAQMINFTIPGTGSSGHIGGGMLLCALLGGAPALLSLAAVLIIQCLFLCRRGLLALGSNIFNIGVIPAIVYPLIYKPIVRKKLSIGRISAAAVISTVIGLQLGAFAVVLETLASGITELPFKAFVVLMQPIHLAIGLVEGIVTAAVLSFIHSMRPELLDSAVNGTAVKSEVSVKVVIILAVITILVGGGLSWFASSNPDGLEWSMERTAGTAELEAQGGIYDSAAKVQQKTAFMPDYDYADAGEGGSSANRYCGSSRRTYDLCSCRGCRPYNHKG